MIRPCKDVPIFMEELDERAFLFFRQAGTDDDGAVWELIINWYPLGLLGRLEGDTAMRFGHARHTELS